MKNIRQNCKTKNYQIKTIRRKIYTTKIYKKTIKQKNKRHKNYKKNLKEKNYMTILKDVEIKFFFFCFLFSRQN